MYFRTVLKHRWFAALLTGGLLLLFSSGTAVAQTGHVLEALGPVNQGMGGAGTALPLDAIGSLQWNPASITGLPCSEMGFSFAALAPETKISSTVRANAFGQGFPAQTMSGQKVSDADIDPIPAFGFVHRSDCSPWAYGIGGFGIAGFGVDYPTDPTNPILSPQPPNGVGFGEIYSSYQMMQMNFAVACQVTDRVSVGLALLPSWSALGVTPFPAAPPDINNGVATYPDGAHRDSRWGLGFQVGVYYENPESGWNFGAAYKSTEWITEYALNSHHTDGSFESIRFAMDYPAIITVGVAYTGFERWDFAMDIRYIDYDNTDGFRVAGFNPDGSVKGFGWESIWAVMFGAQYQLTDTLTVRGGYTYNENPVIDDIAFYNIQAPAIMQNHLSAGFSWCTPHNWTLSVAYTYGFENSISSPWQSPHGGPIPGTSVTSTNSTHLLSASASVRF